MKNLLLCLLSLLAACSPLQLQVPPDATTVAEEIDALFPRVLNENNVPGAAVALVMGDEVAWAKGYGSASEGKEVTPETLFQVASVSKPVAAWGVMRLVQQGVLGLDEPVGRYAECWQLPASKFDPSEVMLRRVLSHTAGLSVGGYYGLEAVDDELTIVDVLNGRSPGDGAVALVSLPGQKESYSGGCSKVQTPHLDLSQFIEGLIVRCCKGVNPILLTHDASQKLLTVIPLPGQQDVDKSE